jgi:hypothetical protein
MSSVEVPITDGLGVLRTSGKPRSDVVAARARLGERIRPPRCRKVLPAEREARSTRAESSESERSTLTNSSVESEILGEGDNPLRSES